MTESFLEEGFILDKQNAEVIGKGYYAVGSTGEERQHPCRAAGHNAKYDAIEVRPTRLPVVGVLGETYHVVRIELHDLERAGSDRLLAHHAPIDMARVYRRPAAREKR